MAKIGIMYDFEPKQPTPPDRSESREPEQPSPPDRSVFREPEQPTPPDRSAFREPEQPTPPVRSEFQEPERIYSARGEFQFQGRDYFQKGAIDLLVALSTSGVRLRDIRGRDYGGFLVQRGALEFEVFGSKSEVETFRRIYKG